MAKSSSARRAAKRTERFVSTADQAPAQFQALLEQSVVGWVDEIKRRANSFVYADRDTRVLRAFDVVYLAAKQLAHVEGRAAKLAAAHAVKTLEHAAVSAISCAAGQPFAASVSATQDVCARKLTPLGR